MKVVASSNLKVETGLSISTSSHVNTGCTSEDAPILLTVQADKVYSASEFAAAVAAANPDMNSAQVARILNAMNEAVVAIVENATDAPTIDLGWGKFVFEIGGSLDTASATPTLLANPCYFSGQVASKYQAQFRLIDATTDTAASPCDFKRVRDKATSQLNTIFGQSAFYADGRGLTFGGTGDKQELWNETLTQKVCDLTLDSSKSYDTSLALSIPNTATVPIGTYYVVLTCAIGGNLYPMNKRVTVATAAIPTPAITKIKEGVRPDNNVGFTTDPVVLTGVFPGGYKTGDVLRLDSVYDGGVIHATMTLGSNVTASTETTITLGNGFENNSESPDSEWNGHDAKVTLVRDGTEYSHTFAFSAA